LIEIVNNSDVNKMTVRNVGIVFAPTLNIPAPVFSMFLTDYDSIFGDTESSSTKPTELTVESNLSPDDIRSPRHQMFSDLPTPSYQQTSFRTTGDGNGPSDGPRTHYDTGFTPMQPSYDQPTSRQEQYNQPPGAGAPYSSLNGMLGPSSDDTRSAKSKRRESSMLFMDGKSQAPEDPWILAAFTNLSRSFLLPGQLNYDSFLTGLFFFHALLIPDCPSGHAALVRKNYDLHDRRMMTLTHLAISAIEVARECLMIMVTKMRLHTKFDGLSILELRVPMLWSATLTVVIPRLFYFSSFFPSFSPYSSSLFLSPHISALPLCLSVHILVSALIYLEIWWSTVTRYGRLGGILCRFILFTIYTICDGGIQISFHL
jgi:hypothetical protein